MLSNQSERSVWRIFPQDAFHTVTLEVAAVGDAGMTFPSFTVQMVRERKRHHNGEVLKSPTNGQEAITAANRTTWEFYQDFLDDVSAPWPNEGDQITNQDDGEKWLVESVTHQLMDTVHVCHCRRLA